jgi:hypothetical protein
MTVRTNNRDRVSADELEKRIYIREHRARILTRLWVSLLGREFLPSRQGFRQWLNSANTLADCTYAIEAFANVVSWRPEKTWDATGATKYVSKIIGVVARDKRKAARIS